MGEHAVPRASAGLAAGMEREEMGYEYKKYANLHGNSGVTAYLSSANSIKITFRDKKKIYVYSYALTGKQHTEMMKSLAESGRGLSAYIARNKDSLNFSIE